MPFLVLWHFLMNTTKITETYTADVLVKLLVNPRPQSVIRLIKFSPYPYC